MVKKQNQAARSAQPSYTALTTSATTPSSSHRDTSMVTGYDSPQNVSIPVHIYTCSSTHCCNDTVKKWIMARVAPISASLCTSCWKCSAVSTTLTVDAVTNSDSSASASKIRQDINWLVCLFKQWLPQWSLGGPPAILIQIITNNRTRYKDK